MTNEREDSLTSSSSHSGAPELSNSCYLALLSYTNDNYAHNSSNNEATQNTQASDEENEDSDSEEEEVFHPCSYSDSDDDSEFEEVDPNEEDEDDYYTERDYSNIDLRQSFRNEKELPFWYSNEDEVHIKEIMSKYSKELINPAEYQMSHQPFIGSVCRSNASTGDIFQTFDQVQICNNQRVPPNKDMPTLRYEYLISSWDEDGMPISFCRVAPEAVGVWLAKVEDKSHSYLYSFPDWQHQNARDISGTRFFHLSSFEYLPVSYANLPWERTPFNGYISTSAVQLDEEFTKNCEDNVFFV